MTDRIMLTAAEVGALSWRDYGGDEMERETLRRVAELVAKKDAK